MKRKINIPRRNTPSRVNFNEIDSNSISVSDTGIVNLSKGNVYFDVNASDESKSEKLYFKVLIKDEWGNLTEMLRNSNKDDVSESGIYVNNQTIQDKYLYQRGRKDGMQISGIFYTPNPNDKR
jgi:hypothetical protein|tara:strand:+ start:4002 stop:4370 length:369 start_codon:yes stop_codon:yes gene_type:complete